MKRDEKKEACMCLSSFYRVEGREGGAKYV